MKSKKVFPASSINSSLEILIGRLSFIAISGQAHDGQHHLAVRGDKLAEVTLTVATETWGSGVNAIGTVLNAMPSLGMTRLKDVRGENGGRAHRVFTFDSVVSHVALLMCIALPRYTAFNDVTKALEKMFIEKHGALPKALLNFRAGPERSRKSEKARDVKSQEATPDVSMLRRQNELLRRERDAALSHVEDLTAAYNSLESRLGIELSNRINAELSVVVGKELNEIVVRELAKSLASRLSLASKGGESDKSSQAAA